MSAGYGSYKTAWRRLRLWQELGVWEEILRALASARSADRVAVDSTTVEAKRGKSW